MNWIPQNFRSRKIHSDLCEEMRLHIEERTEQLMREGIRSIEAERQARVAFGNPTLIEERSRQVWQWPTVESAWTDVRFSLRQLRKSRGITIAAVFTLALAIGANAIVFGLMDGLILRPLNVPQAENLYGTNYGNNPTWQSYPNYLDCAIVTTVSKIWQLSTWSWASVWTRARIRQSQTVSLPPATTSTCCGFIPILAASSMPPMNVARTAHRISCLPTPTGTPASRAIRESSAVRFSSTSTLTPSSA